MEAVANVPGAVRSRPGNMPYRTAADRLADVVSLAILLALGGFAVAVSFTHTMEFIREHGQTRGWVVVGTACTIVLLTLTSAIEVWRDSRARRPRGGPAVIFGVGVVVELTANASTATGGIVNAVVAAWPVPVAATAVWLWTRRLQHAAEAAERAAVDMWPNPPQPWRDPREDDDQADAPDLDQLDQPDDDAELTIKARVVARLEATPREQWPAPADMAREVGSSRPYVWRIMNEYDAAQHGGQVPGQLDLMGATA